MDMFTKPAETSTIVDGPNLEQLEAQRRQNSSRQVRVRKKASRHRRRKGNKAERANNPLMRVGADSVFSYSMAPSNASAPTAAGPALSVLPGLRARAKPPVPTINALV